MLLATMSLCLFVGFVSGTAATVGVVRPLELRTALRRCGITLPAPWPPEPLFRASADTPRLLEGEVIDDGPSRK